MEKRVLDSIKDYKTLMKSLEKSFKSNNLYQISSLQKKEVEIISSLNNRVKIYNSHLKDCKLKSSNINSTLIELNAEIKEFRDRLSLGKENLGREINQVNRIVKPLGRVREIRGERIDIVT